MILFILGNIMAGIIIAHVITVTMGSSILGWIVGFIMLFMWSIYVSNYKFP